MAQETWLLIAVGAGFLLLGIARSPLAWVALLNRRAQAERENDRRFHELSDQLAAFRARVDRCESTIRPLRDERVVADGSPAFGSMTSLPPGPIARRRSGGRPGPMVDRVKEPKLIAVPKLPAIQDRQAMMSGLSQRYAAIWELAEAGASPDAIARATGQPMGQIELILGLRRQMDANRTNIPHASHE
jgi:hypothetical protein